MPGQLYRSMTTTMVVGSLVLCLVNTATAQELTQASPIHPSRWLLLGPAAEALPVFAASSPGGYGSDRLLTTQRLPRELLAPQAGGMVDWFGEQLSWNAVDAGDRGEVELTPPAGQQPAVAWLALYLRSDRWVAISTRIAGAHHRRAWLDGTLIESTAEKNRQASSEVPGSGSVLTAPLKLTTGTHLLLVKTVFDPAVTEPWRFDFSLVPAAGDAAFTCSTDPTRDLDILDILDQPVITNIALSPGGELVALELTRTPAGSDTGKQWLEVRSTGDGSLVRQWRGAPAKTGVAWDPSGSTRLSYVTTGDDKKSTLWLTDLETGTVQALVEEVENWQSYRWSPTGDGVVFAAETEPEEDKRGVKQLQGLLDRQADYRRKSYLSQVTVPGGIVRRLTAGTDTTSIEDIAPDGKRLLFSREIEDLQHRPYSRTEVWQLDLQTLLADKLLDLWWLRAARYGPDGRRLLLRAGPSEFGGAGLDLPPGTIPNDYDDQLYLWDCDSRQVRALTRSFDPAVADAVWSRADGRIYLRAEDHDHLRLYHHDPAGSESGEFRVIDTGVECVTSFAVAAQAPLAVAIGSSVWQPQRLLTLHLADDGSGEQPEPFGELLQPARQRFIHVRRGEVRSWSFVTDNGTEIHGRLYLPPGFDPEKRYPAIAYYYGGTSPVSRDFGGRYPKEWWAANGYVVWVPQPSGCTGRGQAFSARHVNDWGKTTTAEIITGVRQLLAAHPFIDGDRIGCIGASYGGFMTMRLITQTDLFAAAVSHAGISALSSYWGEGYWGYSYGAVANAGSFPWNRYDIFVEHSPLFHADKISTPLLMTHGTADPNVPPGESDQLYIALQLLGVPVELLQVAGQKHFVLDHDKRALWSRSIVAWFDRWLKDQPEWWNDLYPPHDGS